MVGINNPDSKNSCIDFTRRSRVDPILPSFFFRFDPCVKDEPGSGKLYNQRFNLIFVFAGRFLFGDEPVDCNPG
jgi:hypothetical protein